MTPSILALAAFAVVIVAAAVFALRRRRAGSAGRPRGGSGHDSNAR